MLFLSDLEERNVVEQQTLELERRQIQELLTGAMQANLLQLANFARYVQTFRHVPPTFLPRVPRFRGPLIHVWTRLAGPPYGQLWLYPISSDLSPRTVSGIKVDGNGIFQTYCELSTPAY